MSQPTTEKFGRATPLWLGLALVLTLFYGGSAPDVLPSIEETRLRYGASAGGGGGLNALVLIPPVLGLALVGLAASVAVTGPRGAVAALRCLFGRATEAELPLAARALTAGARFVLHAGILAGFLGLLAMLDQLRINSPLQADPGLDFEQTYQRLDRARSLLFLAVPAAILVGRFLLGTVAEAAALRAGVPAPRFSGALQLATLLLIPVFFLLTFLRYPVIG